MFQKRSQLIENKEIFISCIVPVFNEQLNINPFLLELTACLKSLTNKYEIIVVDDGSKDATIEMLSKLSEDTHVKVLGFSRNFGKEIALTAGLEHCKGDVAVLIDADFQHPIELIPVFLEKWASGSDMVYGLRNSRQNESHIKRSFALLFYWLMSKMSKITIPNHAGDFRLLDRKVINALNNVSERTRFMKGLYAWVGFNTCAVPYDVKERASGQSGWGFGKLTELAITGITSFSDVPLRVWSFTGFIISLVSLIYAIYIVTVTLLFGADLPGFPTLVVAIMFFGGVQLLSIGILGEYIARIFTEVKRRPKYIVNVKLGFGEEV